MAIAAAGALGLTYALWSPGAHVLDGRHNLRSNGIWIQHGWLGDDRWFARYHKDKTRFRDDGRIRRLADLLAGHGVKYVFPHLCPSHPDGTIAPADTDQTERFLDRFGGFKVLPWIGGVLDVHCFPESPEWRGRFVASALDLLETHPRLAGLHVNIEPLPSGRPDFPVLLGKIRKAMPADKILSVAAYPPPTLWHRFPEVHWDEAYFRRVAGQADQVAVMMYDTALRWQKPYRRLMADWTKEVLDWAGDTEVLLGLPAYDDAGTGYHHPEVENLENALLGIHQSLGKFKTLPNSYAGIALYSEWEMDDGEWRLLKRAFE